MQSHSEFQTPPPGCPAHAGGERVPLHGPEFAAAPDVFYGMLRQYGPSAPVELAPGVEAELVTDYATALHVLQNPDTFARDSRRWRALNEGRVPMDSPVLPMMMYRPNCMFSDGAEHLRLRQAVTESFARLDMHRVSRHVDRVATYLVDQFSVRGKADLISDYAQLLPLLVFNDLFGCPAEIGDRLISAISNLFDGVDAERANEVMAGSLFELVTLKRSTPGEDITSWLMQHQSRLTDEEMVHQLALLIGAGTEPVQNIIANALRLLLSDEQFGGGPQGGGDLLVEDAINEVLWNSPPIANYATHYPVHEVELAGNKLAAGAPVLISFAAANADPSLSASRADVQQAGPSGLGRRAACLPGEGPRAADLHTGDREAAERAARHRAGRSRGHADLAARPLPPCAQRAARPLHSGTEREAGFHARFDGRSRRGRRPGPGTAEQASERQLVERVPQLVASVTFATA